MFAAFAFWTMKITATTRAAKPAISPVRISLIRVRSCPRPGGRGAGRGGAGPVAEAGGSVLVVPGGAAGSVMALSPSEADRLVQAVAGSLAGRPAAGELGQCLRRTKTTGTMTTTTTIAPKLINMGCSSGY